MAREENTNQTGFSRKKMYGSTEPERSMDEIRPQGWTDSEFSPSLISFWPQYCFPELALVWHQWYQDVGGRSRTTSLSRNYKGKVLAKDSLAFYWLGLVPILNQSEFLRSAISSVSSWYNPTPASPPERAQSHLHWNHRLWEWGVQREIKVWLIKMGRVNGCCPIKSRVHERGTISLLTL